MRIISLHDFEYIEHLEELAGRQTDRLSPQDKEYLSVIASRFREILGKVVKRELQGLLVKEGHSDQETP